MATMYDDLLAMAAALRNPPSGSSDNPSTNVDGYLKGKTNLYNPTFGGVPLAPDPKSTAAAAAAGNLANLGINKEIGTDVNKFNLDELYKQYYKGIPDYSNLTDLASKNIGAALRGEVPSDVVNLLSQKGAERGVMTGGAGSSNSDAAYLRALGLTSLGRMDEGSKLLTEAVGRMPKTPLYDVTKGFVSPEDQYNADLLAQYLANSPVSAAQAGYADMMARLGLGTGYGGGSGGGNTSTNYLLGLLNSMNQSKGAPTTSTGAGQPPYTQGANTYPGQGYDSGMTDADWWYMSGGTSDTDYYPWEELA